VTTIFDYEMLTAEFNHKLVTQLRRHGSGSEFLETWVPDEDPVMSILNMVEAALSAGLDDMRIRFAATTMNDAQRSALLAEVSRIAVGQLAASREGYELAVSGASA
jgi:hypothetical protein